MAVISTIKQQGNDGNQITRGGEDNEGDGEPDPWGCMGKITAARGIIVET